MTGVDEELTMINVNTNNSMTTFLYLLTSSKFKTFKNKKHTCLQFIC